MQFLITALVAVVCIVNGQKSCEKLDDCSCQMTDGTGVVNLTSLGSTLGARFQEMVADENYNYSYNPCFPFSLGDCRNVAGCQSDESKDLYFTLGTPNSANFGIGGETLRVMYSATDQWGITRQLYVTLTCSESAEVPSFEVIGETEPRRYEAVLRSKCACPGLCAERPPPASKDCKRLDQCSCEMSDDSGLVDLRSLGNKNLKPRYKLYIAQDNFFYSYNPCYPFNEGACTNAAMCQLSGDEADQYLIGNSSTASFTYENDNNVHVHYTAQGDGTQLRMTDVRLICDRDAEVARFEPIGEIGNLTYAFNFTSKCVCPNAECT